MTTVWLIRLALLSCLLLGYALRWGHEKLQQARRERIAHALGGRDPEWEKVAQKHERSALYWADNERFDLADTELKRAGLVRALGEKKVQRG